MLNGSPLRRFPARDERADHQLLAALITLAERIIPRPLQALDQLEALDAMMAEVSRRLALPCPDGNRAIDVAELVLCQALYPLASGGTSEITRQRWRVIAQAALEQVRDDFFAAFQRARGEGAC